MRRWSILFHEVLTAYFLFCLIRILKNKPVTKADKLYATIISLNIVPPINIRVIDIVTTDTIISVSLETKKVTLFLYKK